VPFADQFVIRRAFHGTPIAMLCLHEDVAARLEILYCLPVSGLRLRGESKEERDNHRRSDLSLALCGN
jgi:hypothetical protein